MGFREAIDASGWDAKRRQAADDLLDEMRGVLSWGPPGGPYASRIFHNLDADEAVPDVPEADSPVSRLELLDDLLSSGPPHGDALKLHLKGFCRHHKKEGPPDPLAKDRVVGRVWQLDALARHSGDDSAASFGGKALVRETIETADLEAQRKFFTNRLLAQHVMWSNYHEADAEHPFCELGESRAEHVDRLGLGQHEGTSDELVRGSYRLPDSVEPKTPTAWDGGVRVPYWYPGGRTRPLSCDGGGTGGFNNRTYGLPEVVHDAITGATLAEAMKFLAD